MEDPNVLAKRDILLIMEGTYPYNTGGVSTWAHILCQRLQKYNFTLYSVNGNFETKTKYKIGDNIKEIIQVPLWSLDEPQSYIEYGEEYYKIVNKKERVTEAIIKKELIPVFSELMNSVFEASYKISAIDDAFRSLWRFFQKYDYKETMKSKSIWDAYCSIAFNFASKNNDKTISLQDVTMGMKWLYHFLLPISINVPKKDIAHVTLAGFPVLPALVLNYKYNTPLILTEHGVFIRERLIAISTSKYSYFLKNMLIKLSECITKLVYYKSVKILSVNIFNKEWEMMYGADPSKIEVIYNGIDHKLFCPRPKPEHLRDIPTVVAAARIFELKDILTMIQSCEIVKKEIPNVRFLIYGNKDAVPEYTEKCEKLIAALKLQDNFILAGFHEEPHLIYSEGDISILTSISEGFPYTVIESMSCGIPVVATDVGGVTEAIDKTTGVVCKPKDFEGIGREVITLLKNEELRKDLGAKSRKKVIDYFTIETFIKAYDDVYESVFLKEKEVLEKNVTVL